MKIFFRLKLGIMLFLGCLIFSITLLLQYKNLSQKVENVSSSEVKHSSNSELMSISFLQWQGKVRGENSPVKFEKDLETSLQIQDLPTIWFEFADEGKQPIKVEIPKNIQDFIKKRWLNTLRYSYQNQSANNNGTKVNIRKNYLNDTALYATKISAFEIVTPFEKRNISSEEAFEVMRIVAVLAIERYKELQNISLQTDLQNTGN